MGREDRLVITLVVTFLGIIVAALLGARSSKAFVIAGIVGRVVAFAVTSFVNRPAPDADPQASTDDDAPTVLNLRR